MSLAAIMGIYAEGLRTAAAPRMAYSLGLCTAAAPRMAYFQVTAAAPRCCPCKIRGCAALASVQGAKKMSLCQFQVYLQTDKRLTQKPFFTLLNFATSVYVVCRRARCTRFTREVVHASSRTDKGNFRSLIFSKG